MYYILHSENDITLARLAADLELMGVKNDDEWNENFTPYDIIPCLWIEIAYNPSRFKFHNHPCEDPDSSIDTYCGRFWVTERNYNEILETIYEALKGETNERH